MDIKGDYINTYIRVCLFIYSHTHNRYHTRHARIYVHVHLHAYTYTYMCLYTSIDRWINGNCYFIFRTALSNRSAHSRVTPRILKTDRQTDKPCNTWKCTATRALLFITDNNVLSTASCYWKPLENRKVLNALFRDRRKSNNRGNIKVSWNFSKISIQQRGLLATLIAGTLVQKWSYTKIGHGRVLMITPYLFH